MEVLRESLFEGLIYRRDLREFLRNPAARMRHLDPARLARINYAYPGTARI
jgi:hypothetical protein